MISQGNTALHAKSLGLKGVLRKFLRGIYLYLFLLMLAAAFFRLLFGFHFAAAALLVFL